MKKEGEINPNFEGLKQGISISRLINETVHQTVICPMCKNIFWNPRMCSESKCGHTLCEPCLQNSLLTSEICMKCEHPAKYVVNNYIEQQILSKFIFKCEHPKCETQISYNELPYHICGYELVNCKIEGCEWKGERSSLPQHITNCPVEVIFCPNEECKERLRRGELPDHLLKCSFQEVHCPEKCGFQGHRHKLEMHLQTDCELVHLECAYKERGCNLKPIRGEMKSHLVNCRFQPKHLECGHNINLGEFEGHVKDCPDYPLSCVNCGFIFMRGELEAHKCLPFLSEKLKSQEIAIRDMEGVHRAQFEGMEGVLREMRAQIEAMKDKREGRILRGATMCPKCKNLKAERLFHECHVCGSIACEFCLNRCEKCTNIFCNNCFLSCSLCSAKCCKCSPFATCFLCKKYFCQECNPNLKPDQQTICSSCYLNADPVKLLPISATSTVNSSWTLENTVIPGTDSYWMSREYAAGDRTGAEDDITYRVDGGEHLILKLQVISDPSCQFGQMRVFLGVGEDNYVLHSTITQCMQNIEVKFTDITPVQFIKLSFKGVNNQYGCFLIYEMKAFGYKA